MSSPVWPLVVAGLASGIGDRVTYGVSVLTGPVVSGDSPGAYVSVGYLPSQPESNAGGFIQSIDTSAAWSWQESGTVAVEVAALTGSSTLPDAFTVAGLISGYLAEDQTLGGLLSTDATVTTSCDVTNAQTTSGAVQRLILTISYTTRT